MAGYIGSKAVNLSTTGADINGNANVDGTLDVTGAVTMGSGSTSGTFSATVVSAGDLTLGPANPNITSSDANGYLAISGDSTVGTGANLRLFSAGHASNAGDFSFRNGGTTTLKYDDSITSWNFQANDIKTTGSVTAASVSSGTLVAGTATYGGTADVITITTGLSLAALTTGMEIRFRATAANTGATTINVDAIGAVTALTVISTGLPADYIRTDVDTVIRYNGTNWVADREPELGSNANGEYKRWADGTVQAWFFRKAVGDGTAVVPTYTWTLPVAFIITFAGDSRIGFNLSVIGYVNTGGHVYITATNGVALSIQQTGHQIYTDGYTTATMTVKTTVSSSYSSARFVTQRMSAFGTWY